ncbi:hypothetical protein Q5741_07755 [Paenibacillus sp. JX-17]|uniref:DUF4825 domain-containing protein n=1 Tax=Paenibacillus lacisoli TaxID=3064525 RepID=A0ABT9CF43_9BACL|nr:hypothetical protein [Paenibacillus sp. JX-17]MDO7906311.1 hypothetical protein [Paenibacillus sp. JX-17]
MSWRKRLLSTAVLLIVLILINIYYPVLVRSPQTPGPAEMTPEQHTQQQITSETESKFPGLRLIEYIPEENESRRVLISFQPHFQSGDPSRAEAYWQVLQHTEAIIRLDDTISTLDYRVSWGNPDLLEVMRITLEGADLRQLPTRLNRGASPLNSFPPAAKLTPLFTSLEVKGEAKAWK